MGHTTRIHVLLRALGALLPGDRLKTGFYLNFVARPRKALRQALTAFYRMDHVYEVLREVRATYRGRFSILEFGTHDGYAFVKLLYATKYLGMADRVTVHAFDSFEGMPAPADRRDLDVVNDEEHWAAGQFRGRYEALEAHCRARYANYAIHRGYFEESLTPELLRTFATELPILVWIDCDFYSSTRLVVERLLPYLPSGCLLYFDDFDLNFGSRFTGEARVVHELNCGHFGPDVELVPDPVLGYNTRRLYRLVRFEGGPHYERLRPHQLHPGRLRGNGSPLP
jgi:hypothetical protein